MDQLRLDCLKAHNEYRALHGVPPLTLNPTISAVAQRWSEHLARSNAFYHSQGSGYGENLAGAHGDPLPDGPKAVKMLYDEIKDYNFYRQGFASNTGHFTQVVWKGSQELGVGAARQPSGMWVMTFNYSPPGNMMGDFENNVFQVGQGPWKPEEEKQEEKDSSASETTDNKTEDESLKGLEEKLEKILEKLSEFSEDFSARLERIETKLTSLEQD